MKKHFFNATLFWAFYRWLYGLQDVATTMAILMWTDKAQQ